MKEAVTYGNYLRINELLSLQQPWDESEVEHDEMLFIVIHQVYELWFKLILHELDHVCRSLGEGDVHRAQHTLGRVRSIMKVLVAQLDILETMTPLEFLTFRERLESASGFQSDQFRALEFALGKKSRRAIERFPEGSRARTGLEARYDGATLWDAMLHYLAREGYDVPAAHLERDVLAPVEPSEEIQAVLMKIYRGDPKNAGLCERLVDLDEGIQEWRYRHVKMVERTIGTKKGTGGSAGAEYLRSTLNQPTFPDLWEIRGQF